MRLGNRGFVMLQICACLYCAAADACDRLDARPEYSESVQWRNGVIRFDIIEVPASAQIEGVEGAIEFLTTNGRWINIRNGMSVGDGARIRIDAGAKLVLRFSKTEHIEFCPTEEERWIVLQQTTKHGT
jgi:hypothetical protein